MPDACRQKEGGGVVNRWCVTNSSSPPPSPPSLPRLFLHLDPPAELFSVPGGEGGEEEGAQSPSLAVHCSSGKAPFGGLLFLILLRTASLFFPLQIRIESGQPKQANTSSSPTFSSHVSREPQNHGSVHA